MGRARTGPEGGEREGALGRGKGVGGQAEGPQMYPGNRINSKTSNCSLPKPTCRELTFEPLGPQLKLLEKSHMQTFTHVTCQCQFYHILSTHLKYTRSIF